MAEFTVDAHRFDPYKNFKFLVLWDGRTVAGISKISPLKRTTEVVKHRHGGDLADFRKDIVIQVLNEAGQVAVSHKLYRTWPSEYQVLGEMDANANAVAIQSLKLECEGWERDYEVPEPEEPSFLNPA
ncbi:phage tail protein [Streptomyces sp. NPDC046976]|uniref:phage tail protein n=1 Tax=Streptomyces sp. NPDC046976 TaxID=3155258 RepID=UPI0033F03F75